MEVVAAAAAPLIIKEIAHSIQVLITGIKLENF